VKLPAAKILATLWGVTIDTAYARTSGRIHTSARALDDLATAEELDLAELVREFARRRRRYEARRDP
jgi:hypothetical protein